MKYFKIIPISFSLQCIELEFYMLVFNLFFSSSLVFVFSSIVSHLNTFIFLHQHVCSDFSFLTISLNFYLVHSVSVLCITAGVAFLLLTEKFNNEKNHNLFVKAFKALFRCPQNEMKQKKKKLTISFTNKLKM